MFDDFFNLQVLIGYIVFGFGALFILYILAAALLISMSVKCRGFTRKLFYIGGAVSILLPFVFYTWQLHSFRYFIRATEVALIFLCSRRARVLFGSLRWEKPILAITALGCIFPICLGFNIDESVKKPKLTIFNPTYFPSSDGLYPMGSYLYFMMRLKNSVEYPIDHNQLVWNAINSANLDFENGPICILNSPMIAYFELKARLENGEIKGFSEWSECRGKFVTESRTWMRFDPKFDLGNYDGLLKIPSRSISDNFAGVEIREFGVGDFVWAKQTRFLSEIFKGNEYRIYKIGCHKELLHSPYAILGRRTHSFGENGEFIAISVLPKWMSFQMFNGEE